MKEEWERQASENEESGNRARQLVSEAVVHLGCKQLESGAKQRAKHRVGYQNKKCIDCVY